MKHIYHKHKEKINYLLVGGWNTVFGYFAFVALYYLFSAYVNYIILLLISNVFSITNAYVGYKIFVFKTKGNYLKEYLKFYAVYGVSMLLNIILLFLAVELLKANPVVAQAAVIWLTVIISYLGHKHFSFAKKLKQNG